MLLSTILKCCTYVKSLREIRFRKIKTLRKADLDWAHNIYSRNFNNVYATTASATENMLRLHRHSDTVEAFGIPIF